MVTGGEARGHHPKSTPGKPKSSRAKSNKPIKTKEDRQKIRHRERCRVNQELYRERQRFMVQTLEAKIQNLQQEIRILNRQSHENSPTPTANSLWVVATQYFHHYQNFILAPTVFRGAAQEFLRETMGPDVIEGGLTGVETLLEGWELRSLYFDHIQLTLAGMKSYDSTTLMASTIVSFTLSENSIFNVFPYLSCHESGSFEEKDRARIVAKLLGQRIIMRGTVHFSWDCSTAQVVRLVSQANMLSPLLNLLGSVQDVSRVFENARITPDWNLAN
ncbi:hypothetical protein PHMEG_00011600 [Phytophthora megakarya]|uniref:Bzip transcription factor n=1 Tax=Phytophthora megakarya TaxID=4795 RepID=A0A225WAV0_9STRA|nr:hypothetical protein PHMEG_00011600 [Phytophthora megakarya]